jgi:hypothetical protein
MAQRDVIDDGSDYLHYEDDDPAYALDDADDDWAPPARHERSRLHWLIYGGAFALPFALLAVLTLLLARVDGPAEVSPVPNPQAPSPVAAESAAGNWPADVSFAPHTVPALIKNELVGGGARHGYLFSGTAGAVWEITTRPLTGSAIAPLLTLYGPCGGALAAGPALTVILPQDGAYRLVVELEEGSDASGAYRLSVFPR